MTIRVICDGCGKVLEVADNFAGRSGKCTHCNAKVIAPSKEGKAVRQRKVSSQRNSKARHKQSRSRSASPSTCQTDTTKRKDRSYEVVEESGSNSLVFMMLLVLLCGGGIASFIMYDTGMVDEAREEIGTYLVLTDEAKAIKASHDYMLGIISSPSTAVFPIRVSHYPNENSAEKDENGVFVVNSFVDSENAFGGIVRTRYTCNVVLKPDGNHTVSNFERREKN